jgi:hypothetical protein
MTEDASDRNEGVSALELAKRFVDQARSMLGDGWTTPTAALGSVHGELRELEAEIRAFYAAPDPRPRDRVEEELGDVLFAVTILGAAVQASPERALRGTLRRTEQRLEHVRRRLEGQGRRLRDASSEELERLWQEAKAAERAPELGVTTRHKLFLSAPITTLDREEALAYYKCIAGLLDPLRAAWGAEEVYCAALELAAKGSPDTPANAIATLFREIDESAILLLLWPRSTATSALIEVGYALARDKPVVCFHQADAPLPFLLSGESPLVRRQAYGDVDDLARLLVTPPVSPAIHDSPAACC